MTNIEKVKRILDAGHWVNVIKGGYTLICTSYNDNDFSYINPSMKGMHLCEDMKFDNCTIEVIQRIPTPYKPGDKVLVLSNPRPDNRTMESMVGKVCEIKSCDTFIFSVFEEDKSCSWFFPTPCLAPAFDEEEISDLDRIISGKEAKIVIDGKEYSVTLKLI